MLNPNFYNLVLYPWLIFVAIGFILVAGILFLFILFTFQYIRTTKLQTKRRMARHLSRKLRFHGEPVSSVVWVKTKWEHHCGTSMIKNLLNEQDYEDIVIMAKDPKNIFIP